MTPISWKRHCVAPEIIRHAIWLCARVALSFRYLDELLAERGIDVSGEARRHWVVKFGGQFAAHPRKAHLHPSGHWHLHEMTAAIRGDRYWLWLAVDNGGGMLDFPVSQRSDARVAKKPITRLFNKQGFALDWILADNLRSYRAALNATGL